MTIRRKHPAAAPGDTFGPRTVTKILAKDRTANERVEWRCSCGRTGISYVFNLRRIKDCRHAEKLA